MEFMFIQMGLDMKANGIRICRKDMELKSGQMGRDMMGFTKVEKSMDTVKMGNFILLEIVCRTV